MITRTEIIKKLGEEKYWATSKIAKEAAPVCGKRPGHESDGHIMDVAWQIKEILEFANDPENGYGEPTADQIPVILEIYRDMPCYSFLNNCFSNFANNSCSTEQISLLWQSMREFVGSQDEALADPAQYVLWVDFFEDPRTTVETWKQMLAEPRSDRLLERLLSMSGPAPCDLKFQIYTELLPDRRWHQSIFESLYGSEFDYFGQLTTSSDRQHARKILDKLRIPHNDEFRRLYNSLADPVRYVEDNLTRKNRPKAKIKDEQIKSPADMKPNNLFSVLVSFFVVLSAYANSMPEKAFESVSITSFPDGSNATIHTICDGKGHLYEEYTEDKTHARKDYFPKISLIQK